MSRGSERARSAPVTCAVLAALKAGPKLNTDLNQLSPTVNDHIGFLRGDGHQIECQRQEGGLFLYTLHTDKQPPQWSIDVEVTLSDGTVSIQHMNVDAWTARQAKSKARNFAAGTKVVATTLHNVVTGNEHATPDEGH
jgi:biotin operon repressor